MSMFVFIEFETSYRKMGSWINKDINHHHKENNKANQICHAGLFRPLCDSITYNILVNNTYMWKFLCVLIRIGPDTERCTGAGSSKYIFIREQCSISVAQYLCIIPYACLHIHILLHTSNIGWRTNEISLYIKLLLSSYHHNIWNQFFLHLIFYCKLWDNY